MNMRFIPDIMRRFRVAASQGPEVEIEFHNVGVNVGLAKIPLVNYRLPVSLAICQASILNPGIIYIGGAETSTAAGLELDGGRGLLFSTGPGSLTPQQMMLGGLGFGIMSRIEDVTPATEEQVKQSLFGPLGRIEKRVTVINLHNIYVQGSIAGPQFMRVLYILPLRQ